MRILGIDEAGRGPVIGPLVVAGVAADQAGLEGLIELGVRDSKALSRKRRRELAPQIARITRVRTAIIPVERLEENLNSVQLEATAGLICALQPELVYFDVPTNPLGIGRYCQRLQELVGPGPQLIGENHADQRWPIVSAASIMAKVKRDGFIRQLHQRYGDFGWGYPGEPRTREFLKRWYEEHGEFPDCVRMKWITARRLLAEQLTIDL